MAVARSPSPPEAGPRDRLLAGMAEALRDGRSVRETTVADVVARARTSRRTFYEHFRDRDECFLVLFDAISEAVLEATTRAAEQRLPWTARVDAALAAYLAGVATEPELTLRLLQEAPGLGPRGAQRVRRMDARWARQIVRLLDEASPQDPHLRPITIEVATVITGGFRELVLATLAQGRDPVALQATGADLIRRLVEREGPSCA